MDSLRRTNRLLAVLVILAVGVGLKLLQPVLLMFLTSIVLTYLMDPLMLAFRRRLRFPVWLSILLVGLIFLAVFGAVGWVVMGNLAGFAQELPRRWSQLLGLMQEWSVQLQTLTGPDFNIDLVQSLQTALPSAAFTSTLFSVTRSTLTISASFLLVFLFALLTLSAKYYLPRQLRRMFPRGGASRVPLILRDIDVSLRKYISVKTGISLAVGIGSGVIMVLFGLDYALIWGLLIFILNYIPSIGSLVATILPFLFAFTQFNDATPFWILISVTGMQMLTGNVIEPKLMGDILNLSLLVVFLSLLFWGWLWGAAGILLAVPMTTTIKIVLANVPATARFAVLLERPTR